MNDGIMEFRHRRRALRVMIEADRQEAAMARLRGEEPHAWAALTAVAQTSSASLVVKGLDPSRVDSCARAFRVYAAASLVATLQAYAEFRWWKSEGPVVPPSAADICSGCLLRNPALLEGECRRREPEWSFWLGASAASFARALEPELGVNSIHPAWGPFQEECRRIGILGWVIVRIAHDRIVRGELGATINTTA